CERLPSESASIISARNGFFSALLSFGAGSRRCGECNQSLSDFARRLALQSEGNCRSVVGRQSASRATNRHAKSHHNALGGPGPRPPRRRPEVAHFHHARRSATLSLLAAVRSDHRPLHVTQRTASASKRRNNSVFP